MTERQTKSPASHPRAATGSAQTGSKGRYAALRRGCVGVMLFFFALADTAFAGELVVTGLNGLPRANGVSLIMHDRLSERPEPIELETNRISSVSVMYGNAISLQLGPSSSKRRGGAPRATAFALLRLDPGLPAVAGDAEGLQVIHSTLASAANHRQHVVRLPEHPDVRLLRVWMMAEGTGSGSSR